MEMLQISLIILVALVAMGSVVMIIVNGRNAQRARVLSVVGGQVIGAKVASEKDVQNKRRAEIAGRLRDERGGKDQKAQLNTIRGLIGQSGLSISVRSYWIFAAVFMVALVLVAHGMGLSVFVKIMAAVIGLFGFPRFVLKFLAGRRQKQFLGEFADGLEAMVRLLKAGMPISEAVLMISREFDGPLGEEMSIIYDKQKIGIALHEAALETMQRMPLPEVKMFATGLAIQAQTGSSMSEVLQNLANVIRARFKLKRKIKALSSEAIASASIIGSLPIIVAGGMYFVNYEYLEVLFITPFGNVLLGAAVFWMSVGVASMKLMINFKI